MQTGKLYYTCMTRSACANNMRSHRFIRNRYIGIELTLTPDLTPATAPRPDDHVRRSAISSRGITSTGNYLIRDAIVAVIHCALFLSGSATPKQIMQNGAI